MKGTAKTIMFISIFIDENAVKADRERPAPENRKDTLSCLHEGAFNELYNAACISARRKKMLNSHGF